MLTELGKVLRKLRIDNGEKLIDMASRVGKSSSFLSAIEVGTKPPPQGIEDVISESYGLDSVQAQLLRRAADRSRKSFTVEPNTLLGRDTAAMFARRINTLSDHDLELISGILHGDSKKNERD